MVKTTLVTVADDRFGWKGGKYSKTQDKINALFKNNPWFGIDEFKSWKWHHLIQTEFYRSNKLMLDNPNPAMNGRAYKAFVIWDALKESQDGDFVIYVDTSPEMWFPFSYTSIIDSSKYDLNIAKNLCVNNNGILTVHVKWDGSKHLKKGDIGKHTHANFTLDRCIRIMDCWQYRNSLQHASGMIVIQKSKQTMEFGEQWYFYNQSPECAALGPPTLDPTQYNNMTYWVEEDKNKIGHRHDQSISGLLVNKMCNNLVEIPDDTNGLHPYNLLNFCKKLETYTFVNSNAVEKS